MGAEKSTGRTRDGFTSDVPELVWRTPDERLFLLLQSMGQHKGIQFAEFQRYSRSINAGPAKPTTPTSGNT